MRSLKAYAAMGIVNIEEISEIWMILVIAGKTLRKRTGAMDALEPVSYTHLRAHET